MKGLSIGILAALVAQGMAQSATDHPNLKSNNQRTGANTDIINSGPGYLSIAGRDLLGNNVPSALRWFLPLQSSTPVNALRLNEINSFQTVIDNTDQGSLTNVDSGGNPVGPYDPLPNGSAGVVSGTWSDSPFDGEATNAYTVAVRRNANPGNPNAPIDFRGINPNPRFPHYGYARTTMSAGGQNQDPRIAANPAALASFQWTFSPRFSRLNTGTGLYEVFPEVANRSYAIYVWLPVGPTNIGGTNVFPQRYYAYEITYGRGQRYVEIVDTLQAGGNWVRLGNGGRATNQMFPYGGLDGAGNPYPLRVRLLNTIPRDANDQLLERVNTAEPANRFLVYADAVKFSAEPDSYFATPTSAGFGGTDIRVIGARNDRTVDPSTLPPVASTNFRFKPLTVGKGVVTSLDYNFGTQRWRYSPLENGPDTRSFDNTSTVVDLGPLPATQATDHQLARGGSYATTPIVGTVPTNNVRVNPDTNLPDGGYELYMYVGGDQVANLPTWPALSFAHSAEYTITSEGNVETFTIDLRGIRTDQSTNTTPNVTYRPGWVRLGNRRYTHSQAERLEINFLNSSQDPADVGRATYVDQIRFVGSVGTEINSTPVHTRAFVRDTPGGAPVEKNLVIVADERGRLHCLDAEGRPDGTTTCYWTYPSLKADSNTDPNLVQGLDVNDPAGQKFDGEAGTLQAQMATNFDLSTAVVERMVVDGPGGMSITRDYLIIGSANGRVYCIAMEGRGDQDVATNTPGTTFRRWTFPETFPSTNPQNSNLGAISSVVSGELLISGVNRKVIFAATEQGRIYALDAEGTYQYNPDQNLNTTVLWQFPPQTSPTTNSIVGAPTLDVANNRIFFATTQSDDLSAGVYCLDARTGALTWQILSTNFLDFSGGGCYVPATELNSRPLIVPAVPGPMPDTLFIQNDNGYVYAFNANDGSVVWSTNELLSGGSGSLTYTEIRALQRDGQPSLQPVPVIMVPTESGRFAALFARLGEETRFGRRQAWGFETESPIKSTMTVSNKWMFGSTTNGYLFAWSDPVANPIGGFVPNDIFPPGNETITDNNQDPLVEEFRNCRVAYLSAEGFRRLRRTAPGGITGLFNLSDVLDTGTLAGAFMAPNGDLLAPYRNTRSNSSFEWGETIYVIAYNFPVRLTNTATPPQAVPPPILEATVTTEGRATRPIAAEARLFADRNSGDPNGGYAVFAIPLTAGGGTAQTPGPGRIQMQLRTSAVNRTNVQQSITLNPAQSNLAYQVANPIGISVEDTFGSNPQWQLGYTLDSGRPDALANGSPNLTGVPGIGNINGQLFGKSVGTAAHGASKKTIVNIFDRSLITLLRGEGRGLDLTRVDRRDLRWQGGAAAVLKPFANIPGLGTLLANFEDRPTNFPNNSLDYPDMARENVKVRKDPNGNVENPVFNSVSLTGPVAAGGGFVDEFNAQTRVIRPTVFEFQVDVPRYQPTNLGQSSIPNQAGSFWQAGYAGRFTVYVDSDGTGQFTTGNGNRKAYRTFNLASAVSPDERIVIGNPNIDLGSLSGGVGYDSTLTYSNAFPYRNLSAATAFNPYGTTTTNPYLRLFKPIQIFNDGNVNLWNVRLAKGALDTTSGLFFPWQILSQGNRDEVWLDGLTDLHSDLDGRFARFSPAATNNVIVQKPRVGDVNGRQLRLNPTSRLNPNLPQSGQLLLPGQVDLNRDATVAVSIPFGMPVGRYSQLMRVIEDAGTNRNFSGASVGDEAIALGYTTTGTAVPFESFSDPTFTLSFTVRETRLTGGNSEYTNPVVSGAFPVNAAQPAQWMDVQPAGIREVNGDLTFAFASNRPDFYPTTGNPNPNNRITRIFVGRINGANMGADVAGRGLQSTLRDLNQFVPTAAGGAMRWWQGQAILPNLPDATMFSNTLNNGLPSPTTLGGTIVPGTASYGNPVFSTTGSRDMTGGLALPYKLIAYTGTAKRQTPTGVINDSRIFVTRFNNDGSIGTTRSLDVDPTSLKDKPTIIQNGEFATILFSSESNGTRTMYLAEYNDGAGFTSFQNVGFGSGFESVSSPSSIMRMTRAAVPEINTLFTARLRGSAVQEMFMSRMRVQGTAWAFLPWGDPVVGTGQLVENLTFDNRLGGYRPRGTQWQGFYNITLGNGTPVASGPAVVDRQTQIARIPTIFGGDMVIDTSLGLVKFTQANLPQNTQLIISYAPLYLRVSSSAVAGYSSPSMVFDLRLEPSNTNTTYAFWKTPSGADQPATSTSTFSHRFMVSAIRSAASGGQVGRPVMSTFRYGIRLGRALRVNPDGSLAEPLTISNNVGAFQLDPAAGRIYFTMDDEDQVVRINLNGNVFERRVSLIGESAEDFVPMDRPMNESNFNLFLDSQSFPATRRGLVWGIWSSTREGAPSLFMQGMARKITPFLPSQ